MDWSCLHTATDSVSAARVRRNRSKIARVCRSEIIWTNKLWPLMQDPVACLHPKGGHGTDEKLDRSLPVFSGCSWNLAKFSMSDPMCRPVGTHKQTRPLASPVRSLLSIWTGCTATRRAMACLFGHPGEPRHSHCHNRDKGSGRDKPSWGSITLHMARLSEFPSIEMRK